MLTILLIPLSLLLILIYFQFKGITYYDEGYMLNSALRITNGEIPYKDFEMVYTPVSYFFTAIFFNLFGPSVFAGRIGAIVLSVFSLIALSKILSIITQNRFLIYLCLLFFVSWGPAHINFA